MFRGIIHLRLTHNFPGVFTRDTRKCAVRLAHGACVRGQRKAEPWALCPQHTPEIFAVGLHLPCATPQIAFLGSPQADAGCEDSRFVFPLRAVRGRHRPVVRSLGPGAGLPGRPPALLLSGGSLRVSVPRFSHWLSENNKY